MPERKKDEDETNRWALTYVSEEDIPDGYQTDEPYIWLGVVCGDYVYEGKLDMKQCDEFLTDFTDCYERAFGDRISTKVIEDEEEGSD